MDWKEKDKLSSIKLDVQLGYKIRSDKVAWLIAQLEVSQKEVARLRGMLKMVEWVTIIKNDSGSIFVFCPFCKRSKQDGHAPDCKRQ
jgi:hypothetical protein